MWGLVAQPGTGEHRHCFGGRDWRIHAPMNAWPLPITLLTLDLRDPRLATGASARQVPFCALPYDVSIERRAYVFDPDTMTVVFEGPTWYMAVDPDLLLQPSPVPRQLVLRPMSDAEDPDRNPDAIETFHGGKAFLRVGGPAVWLRDPEEVTCTCGREAELAAQIGYDDPREPVAILGTWFFLGELALYFFVCVPCRRVVVVTQA